MGKIAFVFSGQGDQYPGMGKEWYEKYPTARRIYDLCEKTRPGTIVQCFAGTEEDLKETRNTQPCLFVTELAAAMVLLEKGILPDAIAGFSLGEVTAATAGGVFDLETGFRLVCKRGELMQRESDNVDTAMAAVVKLTANQVQEICGEYSAIYPVNFNCPGQITVAGRSEQMADFCADIRAAGGRALPLKVKGAFHSPFMKEAAKEFAGVLSEAKRKTPTVPLYSNVTGLPYGEQIAELLSAQICSPVQWEKLITNMITDGVDTFIEIGPGRTLTNMIRKISAEVKAVSVSEYLM